MNEDVDTKTVGRALELGATMLRAIPRDFPQELLMKMQDDCGNIRRMLREKYDPLLVPFESQYDDWRSFYKQVFNITIGPYEKFCTIPERRYGFGRLIVVAGGLMDSLQEGSLEVLKKIMTLHFTPEYNAKNGLSRTRHVRYSNEDRMVWTKSRPVPFIQGFNTTNEKMQSLTLLEYVLCAAKEFHRSMGRKAADSCDVKIACPGTMLGDSAFIPVCGFNGKGLEVSAMYKADIEGSKGPLVMVREACC